MGADNTYGESNFNPNIMTKTKERKLKWKATWELVMLAFLVGIPTGAILFMLFLA